MEVNLCPTEPHSGPFSPDQFFICLSRDTMVLDKMDQWDSALAAEPVDRSSILGPIGFRRKAIPASCSPASACG